MVFLAITREQSCISVEVAAGNALLNYAEAPPGMSE